MDPTTAALVGAAIGGGASIIAGTIGPWIKDAIDRRARAQAEMRALTRDEVLAVIAAMSALHGARLTRGRDALFVEQHTTAAVSITRLALIAPDPDRRPLKVVLGFALDTISSSDVNALVTHSVQEAANILEKWFRGELRGRQIEEAFSRSIDELRASA